MKDHSEYGNTLIIDESWKAKAKAFMTNESTIWRYSCLSRELDWVKQFLIDGDGNIEWRLSISNKKAQEDQFPFIYKVEIIGGDQSVTQLEIIDISEDVYTDEQLHKIEDIFEGYEEKK